MDEVVGDTGQQTKTDKESSEDSSWIGGAFVLLIVGFLFVRGCFGGDQNPDIRFYNTMVDSNQVFMSSNPGNASQAITGVTRFAEVLTKYNKEELSEDFLGWANRYESALYAMRDTLQQIERQQSGAHLQQLMIESVFRGYMGDPLGTMREKNQTTNQLQWNLQQRINSLQRLNAELDGLREKHGG